MASEPTATRQYPEITPAQTPPTRPISFVVVRYSGDYEHNLLQSPCVHNPLNELITVDNEGNLFYRTLTEAMTAGMARARHRLVVVVHEDVVLLDGWQARLEEALAALEAHDPHWAVVGAVGWTAEHAIYGHWSDLNGYVNSFAGAEQPFHRVARLDEQLLVFDRHRPIRLDLDIPSFHHIGRDVALVARQQGLAAYVVDAPTIHKYADAEGTRLFVRKDSPKLEERKTLTYIADRACCNEYIIQKWPELYIRDYSPSLLALPAMDTALRRVLDRPVVLLARGGGGSRLLSTLAQDLGLFLGNELGGAGDARELVLPIYQGIYERYSCKASWQRQRTIPRLKAAAARMLVQGNPKAAPWGFKLPESLLLLPEIGLAFPEARYIHMVRDPLATCLRRTHMTARLDNQIGRVTLPLAYDYAGRPRRHILDDSPAQHMAYTTIHQLDLVAQALDAIPESRRLLIRFEDVVERPAEHVEQVGRWLGLPRRQQTLEAVIDPDRIRRPKATYPPEVEEATARLLRACRMEYGYLPRS